jgi:putative addiction module component (TIGR02574 family)
MTNAAERLKPQLSRLTPQERAELASFLLDSLDAGADPDAEAAWDAELARRLAEVTSGTATGESANTVLADLRTKYS